MSGRHLAALSLIIALVGCGRPSAEPSAEAFQAFIDSPEAEAARTENGVVEGTLRVFTEAE